MNANHFIRHKQTAKHIKNTMSTQSVIYTCVTCNFKTTDKDCFDNHNNSPKHLKKLESDSTNDFHIDEDGKYICMCGKEYKLKSSLLNHRKKCSFFTNSLSNNDSEDKEVLETVEHSKIQDLENKMIKHENSSTEMANMMFKFMKEQTEREEKKEKALIDIIEKQNEALTELSKQPKTITNIDNRKIDNRVAINVFLNDQCKDAMNLVDFVNTIQCRLEDLEHIGKKGYVEGVSRLMIEGLQKMDITKRPIHCTDSKRDSLYIKDNNEWTKDDSAGGHMKKAIRKIANKGVQKLPEWQEKNPGFNNLKSNTHEKYMGICGNLMGGADDEEDNKNFKKITKRVASEVVIDKDMTTAIVNSGVMVGDTDSTETVN
uniref:C2H2-type domain-containing protein n=1 Tax=viral metagenome TaxID=1070528 RepID=A0A6C0FBN4_9ZZZZ|tara:strand:+ start:28304 stop:29422 length:1119 start_codon:yes stop_codon:yes gene_type:complete